MLNQPSAIKQLHKHHHNHHPTYCLLELKKVDKSDSKRSEMKYRSSVRVTLNCNRKSRGFFNPSFISLALLVYAIFNHSMISILSARKNLTLLTATTSNDLEGFNEIIATIERSSSGIITYVAAEPAPNPNPAASARGPTSRSNRGPPINGSIFGKRSVGSSADKEPLAQAANNNNKQPKLDSQQKQNQQQPQTSPVPRSKSINYNDIITEMIEDFLSLNNES